MRKILLLVLLVVLFFACSNEGLDIKRTPGNVFCQVEQNKCYDVSVDVCEAVGGEEVPSCRLESSSSSADIEVGESSSSESDIEPIDSSSSSEEGIDDSSSSGVVGEGDSSSSGEVGGGDSSSSAEAGVEDSSSSGEAGGPSSSSDGVDGSSSSGTAGSSSSVRLSSSSLAPSLSECDFPLYMHKDETIVLPALPSLVGSCPGTAAVNYTLQIGSSSSASLVTTFPISLTAHSGKNLTIRASVQCGAGAPLTKTCNVFVAENYKIFDHNDEPKYDVSRGSTVIILSMPALVGGSPALPTSLGCEFIIQGTNNVVFYVTTPSKRLSSTGAPAGEHSWWTALSEPFAPTDYTSNHDRILFETQNEGIRCTTFR